jgi:hypothetical protein
MLRHEGLRRESQIVLDDPVDGNNILFDHAVPVKIALANA